MQHPSVYLPINLDNIVARKLYKMARTNQCSMVKVVEDILEQSLENVSDDGAMSTPMNQNIKQREEIREVVGSNITRLRQLNCLSQSALGKLIGLHQQDISQIELGKRKLDVVEAIAISQALGIELEELFEGVVDSKKSACVGFSLS